MLEEELKSKHSNLNPMSHSFSVSGGEVSEIERLESYRVNEESKENGTTEVIFEKRKESFRYKRVGLKYASETETKKEKRIQRSF